MDAYGDVVGFARSLRGAGLPVGVDETATFARALATIDDWSRRDVYLAARATLVHRKDDLPVFDDQFAAYFGGPRPGRGQPTPQAPRHDPAAFARTALIAYMAERADPSAPEVDVPDRERAASSLELLRRKDFGDCTPDELETLARAVREVRFDLTLRESLRRVRARRGDRLDLPRVLRAAARHGGAAAWLPRLRRKIKRRPLVVLADISGSMELYSRILLQLLHGITQRHRRTETFVFGTRLTRITPQLHVRDIDAALDHAMAEIVDYAGGTRISDCLHAFNRRYARRLVRGAVVLLVSDGWETGDPTRLAAEMRRLHDRCHRLVWLNPLLGGAGYEPRAAGMAAALAHVDDFLPVHNLQSLQHLAWHLARIPRRKGGPVVWRPPPRVTRSEVHP